MKQIIFRLIFFFLISYRFLIFLIFFKTPHLLASRNACQIQTCIYFLVINNNGNTKCVNSVKTKLPKSMRDFLLKQTSVLSMIYFYPYKNVLICFFCLDLLPELKAFSKLNENQCLL